MLPRSHRLRDKQTIQKILAAGSWVKNEHFTLKYRPCAQPSRQFTVVISAKTEKKATRRNQLRRRIAEILHRLPHSAPPSYQYILIPRPSAFRLTSQGLSQSIGELFHKIH